MKSISEFDWNKEKHRHKMASNPQKNEFPAETETYNDLLSRLDKEKVGNTIGGTGGILEFEIGKGKHEEAVLRSFLDAQKAEKQKKRRRRRNLTDLLNAFEKFVIT